MENHGYADRIHIEMAGSCKQENQIMGIHLLQVYQSKTVITWE